VANATSVRVAALSLRRAACSVVTLPRSSRDLLAAVHVDDVAGNPVGAGVTEGDDRTAQVGGRGEPVMRVSLGGDLDQLLVPGDFAQRRRIGDAAAQRVDGD